MRSCAHGLRGVGCDSNEAAEAAQFVMGTQSGCASSKFLALDGNGKGDGHCITFHADLDDAKM